MEASRWVQHLADSIRQARELTLAQAGQAIAILRAQLGDRLPNEPDWIDADSLGDDIRRVRATPVPPPVVPATNAG